MEAPQAPGTALGVQALPDELLVACLRQVPLKLR